MQKSLDDPTWAFGANFQVELRDGKASAENLFALLRH